VNLALETHKRQPSVLMQSEEYILVGSQSTSRLPGRPYRVKTLFKHIVLIGRLPTSFATKARWFAGSRWYCKNAENSVADGGVYHGLATIHPELK
jgi:hypothetical protein